MGVKVANYVRTTIADSSGINAAALSFQPASTAGWPTLSSAADYFYLTLVRLSDNAKEIVKVTSYTSTTASITRAQDGTSALAFANADRAELWVCRAVFTDLQAENAAALAAVQLVTANYTALSIPGSALQDNIITNRHIADSSLNGAKLGPAFAGTGLIQDAYGNLQVQGGTYIEAFADYIDVKSGSLVNTLSSYRYNYPTATGKFAAHNAYLSEAGGENVFYTGARPFSPIYGDPTRGGCIVNVSIQNDSTTQDIHVSCYIGSTLSFYASGGGTDVGTEVKKTLLVDSTGFGDRMMVDWTIWVPPGYRYMFAKGSGVGATGVGTGGVKTGGTPNVLNHNIFELK